MHCSTLASSRFFGSENNIKYLSYHHRLTNDFQMTFSGGAQIVTESKSQMSQFQQLEARQSVKSEIVEEQTTQAPVFTSSMKSIEVKEGQRAHFECRIIPVSDPTLKVEWMHNGKPLKQGKLF